MINLINVSETRPTSAVAVADTSYETSPLKNSIRESHLSILLICPPQETVYGMPTMPRLGLAYLSAALFAKDIDHEIIDLRLYVKQWQKVLATRLKKHAVFGITSTTFEFKAAGQVAKLIKALRPQAPVILGGPHATLAAEQILANQPEFDYILKGEGEKVLPEFVSLAQTDAKDGIDDLAGVCRRNGPRINGGRRTWIDDLDDLPLPRYDKFELAKYTEAPRAMQILTSRGCPFGCIYCSVGHIMGRKFRSRSPKAIISEMQQLITRYRTFSFSFNDDNLTFDLGRAKTLCRMIIDSGLDISWKASNGIRVDYLDEELVCLMKSSGCSEVAIGIESINNEILRNLKKGTNMAKIENAVSLIRSYDIALKGFFLIGSPGETRQDVFDSLEYAKKHLKNARFSMLTPYPGTALWQWVTTNNYWTEEKPIEEIVNYTHIGEGKTCYETPLFSKAEKEATYRDVYRQWDKFCRDQSFFGRIKFHLKAHPQLYKPAKWAYQRLKKTAMHLQPIV